MRSVLISIIGPDHQNPDRILALTNNIAGILPGHPGHPGQAGGGGPHEARLLHRPQGQDHHREAAGEGGSYPRL